MNKGIITKIVIKEGKTFFNIRLDRTVKIGDVEYNIYVDADNIKAYLFATDFPCDNLTNGVITTINNKFDFKLKITAKTNTVKTVKLEEVSHGE